MTATGIAGVLGRQVVGRTDAETVGRIEGVVVDVPGRRIAAWQVGKGRKALFVDHARLSGIGDAVIVDDAALLRPASGPVEEAVAKGRDLLSSRVLSEAGDLLGTVVDAQIDVDSGELLLLRTAGVEIPGSLLLGFGSYAVVVALPTG